MATTRKSSRVAGQNARKESRRHLGRTSATSEHNPAPKDRKRPKETDEIQGEDKWVHAYRRLPNMVLRNDKLVEEPAEVICFGERIKFKSNEHGHIVARVRTKEAYERLTLEIPEAYIPYQGGDNIPEQPTADEKDRAPKVTGKFVLKAGDEVMVLDKLDDDQVRAFAAEAGLEDEQLPDVLTGDTLKLAVVNLLTTS